MIICNDIMEELAAWKADRIDYVMTDPPYPTGGESSLKSESSILAAREMIDAMTQSFLAQVFSMVPWRDPERRALWIFCDWRQVSFLSAVLRRQGMPRQSCIVWDKQSGSLSGLYHPSHEMILFACTKRFKASGFLGKDLVSLKRVSSKKRDHPFAKPPELARRLLDIFTHGTVLDPFCGTGGLLLGATQAGHDIVGVEIDRESAKIAAEKLGCSEDRDGQIIGAVATLPMDAVR